MFQIHLDDGTFGYSQEVFERAWDIKAEIKDSMRNYWYIDSYVERILKGTTISEDEFFERKTYVKFENGENFMEIRSIHDTKSLLKTDLQILLVRAFHECALKMVGTTVVFNGEMK